MKPFDLMLLCGLSLGVATTAATAQSWPTKPLRVIIPVAAGGATDIIPRIVLEQLSAQVGQPIIVENRPGAGTTIGANTVAKSDPDGYTILVNGPSHTIAPSLYPKLPYHPCRISRRSLLRRLKKRPRRFAGQGPEDGARPRCRRQGKARRLQFLLGRRGNRDAPERRAVSRKCRR